MEIDKTQEELLRLLKDLIGKEDFEETDQKSFNNLIDYFRKIRAFSHEDRLKLEIIDKSPLTMWACDKNLIIKLWECNGKKIYGYTKEEALNMNCLNLFSNEEKEQAHIDITEIINSGKPYPLCVANDVDRDGVTHEILNYCSRIFDKDNNEYLQAELGLDITHLMEQRGNYSASIIKRQKIVEIREQLKDEVDNLEIYFNTKKNDFYILLTAKEKDAINSNKRNEFQIHKNQLREQINDDWLYIDIENIKLQIDSKNSEKELSAAQNRNISKLQHKIELYFRDLELDLEEICLRLGLNENVKLFDKSNQNESKVIVNVTQTQSQTQSQTQNAKNEQNLKNSLMKEGIAEKQIDELIKILREEKQDIENRTLGTKAKEWCGNIKTIGLNILSNMIFQIMYGLPPIF